MSEMTKSMTAGALLLALATSNYALQEAIAKVESHKQNVFAASDFLKETSSVMKFLECCMSEARKV